MAVEAGRGCGYRKVGGLYLVGTGLSVPCDRLPLELCTCPICGHGVKFSRGFTWLDYHKFFGKHQNCQDHFPCFICCPDKDERYGLLWVGEKFYTTEEFIEEAKTLGVSKRIPFLPKGLKAGAKILLAHKKAIQKTSVDVLADEADREGGELFFEVPGIFYAFQVSRIEKLIWKSEEKAERAKLEKRGITPVVIPDGESDHSSD